MAHKRKKSVWFLAHIQRHLKINLIKNEDRNYTLTHISYGFLHFKKSLSSRMEIIEVVLDLMLAQDRIRFCDSSIFNSYLPIIMIWTEKCCCWQGVNFQPQGILNIHVQPQSIIVPIFEGYFLSISNISFVAKIV